MNINDIFTLLFLIIIYVIFDDVTFINFNYQNNKYIWSQKYNR